MRELAQYAGDLAQHRSPTMCEYRSLIDLKWSMSIMIAAIGRFSAAQAAMCRSSARRLASPVSGSSEACFAERLASCGRGRRAARACGPGACG